MKTPLRFVPLFAAVIVLMTGSHELLAQEAAPIFTERFANAFDPASRTYFSVQGTEGEQFGGQQPYASFGASHFAGSITDSITLYSGQLMMNYNGLNNNPAGTLGVQQRWLTSLPVADTSILGAGLYLDFTQSRYNNTFQQLDINLELISVSSWLTRLNIYVPVGQLQQQTGLGSFTGGAPGQIVVLGTAVGTGGIRHQWMDVALTGTDWEFGRKLFNYRAEVYGGWYTWSGDLAGFTNGVKGGIRGYLTENLSGNVNISHDDFFGTNVYGGMTYFFGGSGGSQPMSFANLMTLPAVRSQQVSVINRVRDVSAFTPLRDVRSGDELHLYFVEENGTGAGTQNDPSNVKSVLANPLFGVGSGMVLLDSNGTITDPISLVQDRQQVLGGGATGTATVDFSLALGQPPGTSVVNLTNLGGRPVLAPPSGNAITLSANQNVIKGFTIDGGGGATAGIVGFPQISDTVVNDMVVRNVSGTGIMLNPAIRSTVGNVTFSNNGTDLRLSGANATINNIVSTGALNGSLDLGGTFGLPGTTQISNVNISGAGGFGGILLSNIQNGETVNLTNVSVTGGAGSGVTVTNSQAGSIYNLTNVDILNVGNVGMALLNSDGMCNVNATSSITDVGSAGLEVSGGSIDVNFAGTITQAVSDASAVLAAGSHNGTVQFLANSSINTSIGDGLQFNNADGIYNFLGTITMNGGDAGIDIFNSSSGAFTFNNPLINNTAGGAGVRIVGSAGNLPLTTFNGLDISTNGNTGFFVSTAGLTQVGGTARVVSAFGQAIAVNNTAINMNFTEIDSDNSTGLGIDIQSATGNFDSAVTQVTNAAGDGIRILNSAGLTSIFHSVNIGAVGTNASENGVTLDNAGTVSFLAGAIDGTSGDGINSRDTNLTVTGLNIGSGAVNGDGIEIINLGTAHTVNLSNNTIIGNAGGISTADSGNAGELLLTLDGNTVQSLNAGSLALKLTGAGLNSTIVRSMNGGTIVGGASSGGVLFDQVTFDASGTALSGAQVNAGDWTIGTTANRVQGDGLRFEAPTGDVAFGDLNIANNGGTGLLVDTKTLGTTFNLVTGGGAIDTTGGAAMNLDPLTVDMTLDSVTSTDGSDGVVLDGVAGNVHVAGLTTINGATFNGIDFRNSSAHVTFDSVAISDIGARGVNGFNNTGLLDINGGTIDNIAGTGIELDNTSANITGITLSNFGSTGINANVNSAAMQLVVKNSTIEQGGGNAGITIGGTGTLNATITGNTIDVDGVGIFGSVSGPGSIYVDLSSNTLHSNNFAAVVLSRGTGNSVTVTGLADVTVTGAKGGLLFDGVTFDSDPFATGIQTVNGGNTTIGSLTSTTDVTGNGLFLRDVSGSLSFGTLNIGNDSGTGLSVNTKVNNTTFDLSNTGGAINTTNGAAMFLDPVTTDLTFSTVSSTNSLQNAIKLDSVAGTLDIGTINVTNTLSAGIFMSASTADVTIGQVNVDGAARGIELMDNLQGSFTVTGVGAAGAGGTIKNLIDCGALVLNSASTSLNNMVIDASSGTQGVRLMTTAGTTTFSLTNSTVQGSEGVFIGADLTGTLNATVSGNTLTATNNSSSSAAGFTGITSVTGNSGGTLNLAFSNNTLSSAASAGAYISSFNPGGSTTGGTVTVTDFADNVVTQSNSGGSSGPLTGGIRVNGVTFDADLSTAGIQTVNGGTLTIGAVSTDVVGDGLQLNDVSGALTFTTMNIHNDDGTGLYVNTKLNNTTFTLTNTNGVIDTTNGAAMFLDPLTAFLTFNSVSSTNSATNGVTLDTVGGYVNLGNTSITNAAGSGISMINSSAGVTTGNLDINGAATGLTFGQNTSGTFIATGTTTLSNITGTGVNLTGATGYYQFADLNVSLTGANTGLDFRNSNVQFTSANTTITGDGTLGSIGIDLSGSLNPNGANSTTSNIQLANGGGLTAIINSVDTGILLGNAADGSAGAYFIYGNQTPLNSGSQINANTTLDTTNLTSTNGFTQGRYEFLGVGFTGIASFQKSSDLIFVGSTSSGANDGSSIENRISGAELLTLDANPANLDGKVIVLVNDNAGVGINLGANTLTLGDNTILDSFGNGQTFSTAGTVPVNVIVDTITGGVTFSDPNGAGTLTNNGSTNIVTLGNSDTIQNVILSGGANAIFGSGISGVDINNNTITGSSVSGINLVNTTGTQDITQNAISSTGVDGILLTNAGTVTVTGGSINVTGGDGIHSSDTNLTVTGVTIGGTGTITGDGIEIVNNGTAHTVNLSNNTINAVASGISTKDSGVARELVLTLDGNTLQSTGAGSKALSVVGSGLNSTIVQSMNGGTVIGNGTGGGVEFDRVTFDASGAALTGTQVNAGNWTIGTTGARVQGDGLRFDSPTGDLKFGTLDIANNAGTGLYVDTKTLGTTFALGNTGGIIDTTAGSAMFLDPLTVDLTFSNVTSANSTGTGVILDTVAGTLNITNLNISNAAGDGLSIANSSGLTTTIQSANISTIGTGSTRDGVNLNNAGTVNILGGTIDSTTGDGIHSSDTNLTVSGLTIGGTGTIVGDGIEIVNNGTAHTVNLNNNTITAVASGISTKDSGVAGELLLSLDGNTLQSTGAGSKALSLIGSGLNSTIVQSMDGGTVIGNGIGGGVEFNRITFDASGTALSGTSVNAGDWTIGTSAARVEGDGLRFDAPTGDLQFGDLNIANNNGTGLFVDTKTLGTTFAMGSTGGSVDTTNGAAMFLDPLTTNLTFGTVSSTNSTTDGVTIDTVAGTISISNLNVSNATGSGLSISNSKGLTTIIQSATIDNVDGDGVTLTDAGGFSLLGGTIDTTTGDGIFSNGTDLIVSNVTIGGTGIISGDGIAVLGDGGRRTISISDSTITADGDGIFTMDTGSGTGELLLFLSGNTLQSTCGCNALEVVGNGLNTTIVQSMFGGSVVGSNSGGVVFDQVTFDGSGASLTGIQVNAGNWTIGTTGARIQGDGLVFDGPSGDVLFTSLNIANDNGTGLSVDTKFLGTTFNLDVGGGSIDTTNGSAMFLDPLSVDMTLSSVSSTNSATDGITLDTVSGTLNIGTVTITNTNIDGIFITNSSVDTTINQFNVDGADIAADLFDNTGSFTVTGIGGAGAGGTLTNLFTGGVLAIDNASTSLNNMIIDGSGGLGGVAALVTTGTNTVSITNCTITGGFQAAVQIGADETGIMNATITGNTLNNSTASPFAAGLMAFTSGDGLGGGELNLAFNNNTVNVTDTIGVLISDFDPFFFTSGGPVTVTEFSNNTVTNAGFDGVDFFGVTFDSDLLTAGIQTVNAGTLTIGDTSNTTNILGNGLLLDGVSGALSITTLDIGNDSGIGLLVDTKTAGTTFSLSTAGGTINTTNGSAMFLDPLTTDMTLTSVTSTDSDDTGITLDQVSGTLNIGTLTVSGSAGDGVWITDSDATVDITGGSITGVLLGDSFHVEGGSANVTYGGTISSSSNLAVRVNGTTGGAVTFDGTITEDGSASAIRLTSNAGSVTFNGNVSLGATTALTSEAVYLTNNTGAIAFGDLDVTVNTLSGLGAIYGLNNSSISTVSGDITATGTAALNIDQSAINMTLDSITASGGTNGVSLTNLATGSTLNATTTTVSGVEQTGIKVSSSLGTYNFGTLAIDGAKNGAVLSNSGTVIFTGGTIDNITVDAINSTACDLTITGLSIGGIGPIGGDGIQLTNVTAFSLNNTSIENTIGFTLNSAGSALSGSGNTASSFNGNDGGGNTGSVSFNGGANIFP